MGYPARFRRVFEPPERRSGKCVTVRRAVRRVLALHNHLEAYRFGHSSATVQMSRRVTRGRDIPFGSAAALAQRR